MTLTMSDFCGVMKISLSMVPSSIVLDTSVHSKLQVYTANNKVDTKEIFHSPGNKGKFSKQFAVDF